MPHADKIYDYILMTAMLGNDFMPHFPSVNIRTAGIDIMLDTYGNVIKDDEVIFNGETINWSLFKIIYKDIGCRRA